MASQKLIETLAEIPTYSPPGHSDTVNRRLIDRAFCGHFEMILGEIAPGGLAERHAHDVEDQAIYILSGEAEVSLGDHAARRCGTGTIIRVPRGLPHEVRSVGSETLKLIVIYSPPLLPRGDRPI